MLSNRSHDVLHAFSLAIEGWRSFGTVPAYIINFAHEGVAKGAAFETKLKAIEADRNLSEAGQLFEKGKAATTFLEELEAWAAPAFRHLTSAGDKIRKDLEDAIAPTPHDLDKDPVSRAAAASLRAEVRAIADTLSDNETMLLFLNGDSLIRAALVERQRISGGDGGIHVRDYVEKSVRESALVESARHARPELAKALKENDEEVRMTHEVVDTITTLVRSLVPTSYVAEPIQPLVGALRVLAE